MESNLSLLINQGFFLGARKEIMAELLDSAGFNCSVLNNEFYLEHENFSLAINDSSSTLIGDDSCIKNKMNFIKEKAYGLVCKGILKKKSLLNSNAFDFIQKHLNPLVFQCFHDFKINYSKVADNLSKKGLNAVFFCDFLSIQFKNSHYSIKIGKNEAKRVEYSNDFFNLKSDELFIGFPYCAYSLTNPFKEFSFGGSMKEFEKIAFSLIDELHNQISTAKKSLNVS